MDSTIISGKRHLFALSIVDGALDDMDEERRNEIIMTITEIKQSMLSGGDASACSKKNKLFFFETVRPNNSLLDMTPRNDRSK